MNFGQRQNHALSLLGVCIAFGLPAAALLESHVRHDLYSMQAALLLAVTPWLIVIWVMFVERRTLSSIGLRWPQWSTVGYATAGVVVNVAISVVVGALAGKLGIQDVDSGFPEQLIREGYGWLLVLFVTGGAFMTEIAFRGYALERLTELTSGRRWIAAVIQITFTTALFWVSRPAHTPVWIVDDIVFTTFYFWRRDTTTCLAAHAVPNFLASMLVVLRIAQ
jgi:membrane protease YdiL (CAAX protease family)